MTGSKLMLLSVRLKSSPSVNASKLGGWRGLNGCIGAVVSIRRGGGETLVWTGGETVWTGGETLVWTGGETLVWTGGDGVAYKRGGRLERDESIGRGVSVSSGRGVRDELTTSADNAGRGVSVAEFDNVTEGG
jgi:hypothetical protein